MSQQNLAKLNFKNEQWNTVLTQQHTICIAQNSKQCIPWWHTRRNQIRSSNETDESIYIGGGVSSVEYWLSWSEGRGRTIVVTLDGLFRVKLKAADYPHHSPLSPSLLLPCVTLCHQIPFPLYQTPTHQEYSPSQHATTNILPDTTKYRNAVTPKQNINML